MAFANAAAARRSFAVPSSLRVAESEHHLDPAAIARLDERLPELRRETPSFAPGNVHLEPGPRRLEALEGAPADSLDLFGKRIGYVSRQRGGRVHDGHHALTRRVRTLPPRDVRCSRSSARRQQPAQIGQAIQVRHHLRAFAEAQRDGQPLRASDDGASQIERRAGPALARHDELGRHGTGRFELVNTALESIDHLRGDERHSGSELATVAWCRGDLGHQDPEPTLESDEFVIELRARDFGPGQTQSRLRFVDDTIRVDPLRVLADPPSVEETRGAVVAPFRRDAHRTAAYWRSPQRP